MSIVNTKTKKRIKKTYEEIIDEAIIATYGGEESFDAEMIRVIQTLGEQGIKTIDYESGYSQRVDTAVRRNIMEGINIMYEQMQMRVGKKYGANGIEISAHFPCAIDHQDIQGRQYSIEEYEKLNDSLDRPIGTLNCGHYPIPIILGISEPTYTEKELKKMTADSNKKIEFRNRTYTVYEATQYQRRLEVEIRKAKESQILSVSSHTDSEILKYQQRITKLTKRYNDLSDKAGIIKWPDRMRVSGYKRVKVN